MEPNEEPEYLDYVARMTNEFISKSKDYTIEEDLVILGRALHKIKNNLEEIDALIYRVDKDASAYARNLHASDEEVSGIKSFSGMLEFTWGELHERICGAILYHQELKRIAVKACKLSLPQD